MSGSERGRSRGLPGAGELAEMLRDGATVEQIAQAYDVAPISIAQKINNGGYSRRTGEPQVRRGPHEHKRAPKPMPGPWRFEAACTPATAEAFHPGEKGDLTPSKTTCAPCPVRLQCLAHALEHDERVGVWGGLSERERRALHRRGVTADDVRNGTPAFAASEQARYTHGGRYGCPHCPLDYAYPKRLAGHITKAHPQEEGAA